MIAVARPAFPTYRTPHGTAAPGKNETQAAESLSASQKRVPTRYAPENAEGKDDEKATGRSGIKAVFAEIDGVTHRLCRNVHVI
jgi:hypothetical protein